MNAKNHRRTSLALSFIGGAIIVRFGHQFPVWTGVMEAGRTVIAATFLIGGLPGARAPDWLEVPVFLGGDRQSLIPHRTITHWPYLWLAIIAAAVLALGAKVYGVPVGWLLLGFALTALWHVVADAPTPSGVPVGPNPFGERTSLFGYRVGGLKEEAVAIGITASGIVAGVLVWNM